MKKLFLVIVLLINLLSTAYAVKMKSIYGADVLVASQEEQARNKAIEQAFAQTLTKVSGSSNVLQDPVIKAALPQAKNDVQEFGYTPSGDPSAPFLLNVKFDPQAVKQLLRQAKAPIWDENRPLILVWISTDNAALIDNGSPDDFAAFLKMRAAQRGVPLLLPMMDVTDLSQVTAEDVRAMAILSLQKASRRYHADGILIGNIQHNGKAIQSHWKLIVGMDQQEWRFNDSLAAVTVEALIDRMVGVLGGRYATVQSEKSTSAFTLVVKGVSQEEDLQELMHFVKHLSLIKEYEVENINGDEVIMHLVIQGGRQTFMQDASVEQHLHVEIEEDDKLTYLWMR